MWALLNQFSFYSRVLFSTSSSFGTEKVALFCFLLLSAGSSFGSVVSSFDSVIFPSIRFYFSAVLFCFLLLLAGCRVGLLFSRNKDNVDFALNSCVAAVSSHDDCAFFLYKDAVPTVKG